MRDETSGRSSRSNEKLLRRIGQALGRGIVVRDKIGQAIFQTIVRARIVVAKQAPRGDEDQMGGVGQEVGLRGQCQTQKRPYVRRWPRHGAHSRTATFLVCPSFPCAILAILPVTSSHPIDLRSLFANNSSISFNRSFEDFFHSCVSHLPPAPEDLNTGGLLPIHH